MPVCLVIDNAAPEHTVVSTQWEYMQESQSTTREQSVHNAWSIVIVAWWSYFFYGVKQILLIYIYIRIVMHIVCDISNILLNIAATSNE